MNPVWLVFLIFVSFSTILVFADSHDEIDLLSEKGLESYFLGDRNEAISYFDQILEIDPNNIDAMNNKGGILLEQDKIKEAVLYFDKILEIDPNNPTALTNKGLAFARLHRVEEAISYFYKALEFDPNRDFTKYNLDEVIDSWYVRADGYAEIIVYDSQHRLVTHMFSPEIYVLDTKTAKDAIAEWPVSKVVNRNGQDFNVHQSFFEKIAEKDRIIGKSKLRLDLTNFAPEEKDIVLLLGENPYVIRYKQSQYIVEEGDSIFIVYTFFRPVE